MDSRDEDGGEQPQISRPPSSGSAVPTPRSVFTVGPPQLAAIITVVPLADVALAGPANPNVPATNSSCSMASSLQNSMDTNGIAGGSGEARRQGRHSHRRSIVTTAVISPTASFDGQGLGLQDVIGPDTTGQRAQRDPLRRLRSCKLPAAATSAAGPSGSAGSVPLVGAVLAGGSRPASAKSVSSGTLRNSTPPQSSPQLRGAISDAAQKYAAEVAQVRAASRPASSVSRRRRWIEHVQAQQQADQRKRAFIDQHYGESLRPLSTGQNKTFFDNRLVFGPDVGQLGASLAASLVPAALVSGFLSPDLHPALLVLEWVLWVLTAAALLVTASRNPGIVQRRRDDVSVPERVPAKVSLPDLKAPAAARFSPLGLLWPFAAPTDRQARMPSSKKYDVSNELDTVDVPPPGCGDSTYSCATTASTSSGALGGAAVAGGVPLREVDTTLRYCFICYVYRGPRTHHCRRCDNCVDIFDHHCPWTGTCIGGGNYHYFMWFLAALNTYILLTMACAIAAPVQRSHALATAIHAALLDQFYMPIIIVAVAFLAGYSILGLFFYHLYISAIGVTTLEHIRQTWRRPDEPENSDAEASVPQLPDRKLKNIWSRHSCASNTWARCTGQIERRAMTANFQLVLANEIYRLRHPGLPTGVAPWEGNGQDASARDDASPPPAVDDDDEGSLQGSLYWQRDDAYTPKSTPRVGSLPRLGSSMHRAPLPTNSSIHIPRPASAPSHEHPLEDEASSSWRYAAGLQPALRAVQSGINFLPTQDNISVVSGDERESNPDGAMDEELAVLDGASEDSVQVPSGQPSPEDTPTVRRRLDCDESHEEVPAPPDDMERGEESPSTSDDELSRGPHTQNRYRLRRREDRGRRTHLAVLHAPFSPKGDASDSNSDVRGYESDVHTPKRRRSSAKRRRPSAVLDHAALPSLDPAASTETLLSPPNRSAGENLSTTTVAGVNIHVQTPHASSSDDNRGADRPAPTVEGDRLRRLV